MTRGRAAAEPPAKLGRQLQRVTADHMRRQTQCVADEAEFGVGVAIVVDERGDFAVVDSVLGALRPVSSLSGGETFIASLALGLAFADVLAGTNRSSSGSTLEKCVCACREMKRK